MAKTALELTPEEWKQYEPWRNFKPAVERWERAWKVAREAADLLKNSFHVRKVVVFGSLTNRNLYTAWSDIDLAVWGLQPESLSDAMSAVSQLSDEFDVDLIAVEYFTPQWQQLVEEKGIAM